MDLKGKDHPMRRSFETLFSDQKFLLNFIMSTYLGPDVKSDKPRCSTVQRHVAGLPPYTLSDLGPSYVSISLLERLYYYVLRDAHPDLVVELNMLRMYLKGSLFLPSTGLTEDSQQFTSFFPLILHKQIWYPEGFRIIKGIVFIDDPVMSYVEEEDIDRFKSLSGVSSLKVDINECLRVQLDHRAGKEGEHNGRNMQKTISSREGPHLELDQKGGKEGEHKSMNKGHETISNGECLHVELDQQEGKEDEHNSMNKGQEAISNGEFLHVELDQQEGKKGEHNSVNEGQETISSGECLHVELDHQAGKESEHGSRNKGQESISSGKCLHVELDHRASKESEHGSRNKGQETISSGKCLHVELDHLVAGKDDEYDIINKGQEIISDGECPSRRFQQTYKRKRANSSPPIPLFPHVLPTKHNNKKDPPKRMCKSNGPTVMPLLSIPDIEDCDLDSSLLLTGTARRALFGPSVGVVDVGTSKVAYLFRVSLPGVKKDYSCQFSCEVESDGRVHIRGLMTGGRIIVKQARVFEMKYRQLCSPGPFTLSFSLPGPVDPRLFAPNFRSDGIFEAVVIKA